MYYPYFHKTHYSCHQTDESHNSTIQEVEQELLSLIEAFDLQATPYKALRRKDFKGQYQYDDYAHLARVDEWGANEGQEA